MEQKKAKKSNHSKINVNGTLIRTVSNENGGVDVTFSIPNYFQKEVIATLELDQEYDVSINLKGRQRTNRQNGLMWQLLTEIGAVMGVTKEDAYCLALQNARVDSEMICCKQEAYPLLVASNRGVRYLRDVKDMPGYKVYEVFKGSSQMNTKEMTILIDEVLNIANQVGLNYQYWGSLLIGDYA